MRTQGDGLALTPPPGLGLLQKRIIIGCAYILLVNLST